ncbi:MAG: class II aldolase/adducin family protein [Oxalicibacterium faecigallinarum]|uniref:class II aldolase/adducin family protein n=1 Tax=Oxalicibacterium faecigallinarum TaxID=573741 RepID=UPI002807BAE8|nr:class II aldolase/adducin family protein [Oxalicibacterium faecigallinarum]MDQ7969516.1 class II aldolase/adducin family protein [Oxalicibacterium faecigallinarum]
MDPRNFPRIPQPVFNSVEEERQHRKIKLAAAFRIFGRLNYDEGVMGHISARDPEVPEHYWMNPFGVSFNQIKASDLLRVSLDGELIEGNGLLHPGGVPTHSAVLRARPDIISVAHTHSTYGTAWSAQDRLLDPISAESAVFYERHALYDSYASGERENLAAVLENNKAIIFKSHGLFTVGQSVDEAVYFFLSLEKVCKAQLAAESTGRPLKLLTHDHATAIANRVEAYAGWLNFQPAYQHILAEHPELAH